MAREPTDPLLFAASWFLCCAADGAWSADGCVQHEKDSRQFLLSKQRQSEPDYHLPKTKPIWAPQTNAAAATGNTTAVFFDPDWASFSRGSVASSLLLCVTHYMNGLLV